MPERSLRGVPASPGAAAGPAHRWDAAIDTAAPPLDPSARPGAEAEAVAALERVGLEIDALAERLRGEGRSDDAEIIATGALMAGDPALLNAVRTGIRERGESPATAILTAGNGFAAMLAEVDDEMLSARAADVRSIIRRAVRITSGGGADPDRGGVVVAEDLGPADVAELTAGVQAIALAQGSASGHAAIVARSLGLPMVLGIGEALEAVIDGATLVVDGDQGIVVCEPEAERVTAIRIREEQRHSAIRRASASRDLPARTLDGREITVLANAAGTAELEVALAAGAEGVGLLRTELGFLQSRDWPTFDEHCRLLVPVLRGLAGRPLTIRLLDFGGDKVPPFLAGTTNRGVELLLATSPALEAQLSAIVTTRGDSPVRVLIPMVTEAAQVLAVRRLLVAAAADRGVDAPALGAMVEVPAAVAMVAELAAVCDFLSIGTNDLAHFQLGIDRAVGGAAVHHPGVLRPIAATVEAAHDRGIVVEVCGEAAGDPRIAPILIGLGVDELSVGASRVGQTRELVRSVRHADAAALARRCLAAGDAAAVLAMTSPEPVR